MIKNNSINLGGQKKTFEPVIDVYITLLIRRYTLFKVHGKAYRGKKMEIDTIIEVMVDKYFPHDSITSMVGSSNKYIHGLDQDVHFLYARSDFSARKSCK